MKKIEKIIIGIDGAPFSLINQLSNMGVMNFFNQLKKSAVFKRMNSSIPFISSVSWSSIITGTNPATHGIFGFTDIIDGTYSLSYPNFLSLKSAPFWQKSGQKSLIINVPATYPAQKLTGAHISGFVSPSLEHAVYPKKELATLEKFDYQIDLDSEQARQSSFLFYNQLFKVHKKREAVLKYLTKKYQPQILMYVITGSDRLGHFCWQDWKDKDSPSHHKFLEFFRLVDLTIERIVRKAPRKTPLVILSDHGMEESQYDLNINQYLVEEGFLKLDPNQKKKFNRIKKSSVAFGLEHGRIYLNYQGRYPKGNVKNSQRTQIIEKLTAFFDRIKLGKKKAIKKIYRREKIYQGKQLDRAPDLILIPEKGINLLAKLDGKKYQKSTLSGIHNDQAFLLVKGRNSDQITPKRPQVEDITKILNKIQ